MFELVPQLAEKDHIIDLKMSRVLFEDNSYYPWVILVPKVDRAKNMLTLSMEQRIQLMREIALCEEVLSENFAGDQTNIVIAPNESDQLSVNVIVRRKKDKEWPGYPVSVKKYKDSDKKEFIKRLERAMRIKQADSKYMQF